MRIFQFKSNDGGEAREYKMALKEAKSSLARLVDAMEVICELAEEMEDEYGMPERRQDPYRMEYRMGYRGGEGGGNYSERQYGMNERRGRDGRFVRG